MKIGCSSLLLQFNSKINSIQNYSIAIYDEFILKIAMEDLPRIKGLRTALVCGEFAGEFTGDFFFFHICMI